MKHHLFVTDFWILRKRHSFSFNPKICIPIRIDEVLDSFFVTKFGTKNVIFVTIATNRPCNTLIFKYIFRVWKSPWEVRVLLHREIAFPHQSHPHLDPFMRMKRAKWRSRPQNKAFLRTRCSELKGRRLPSRRLEGRPESGLCLMHT